MALGDSFRLKPQAQAAKLTADATGKDFQLGELAWLKSGGPAMTVKKLGEELTCVWFSVNHECHEASFARALLTRSKPVIGDGQI